jgi:hypothetical protein
MNPLAALVTAVLSALGLVSPAPPAPAAKAIARGSIGHDISWPQCGKAFPKGSAFGIVGVTDGKPYFGNPCLAAEFAWAEATPGGSGFYMNTANPGTASTVVNWYAQKSPDAGCSPANNAACAYDYGWNAAANAVNWAQAKTGKAANRTWWLDIETDNSWSATDLASNFASIRGSVDFLKAQPGVLVGIYSTRFQWTRITGGAQLPLANWVAGARNAAEAKSRCTPDWSASGGPVVLTQFFGQFDGDYAC